MPPIRAWLARHLILSLPAYCKAKTQLSKQLEDSTRHYGEEFQELSKFVVDVDHDVIQRHRESAAKHLKSIEDKARTNLLGITIGIAVLFSGFNWVVGGASEPLVTGWVRVLSVSLFSIAVSYLLLGGLMALRALRLMPLFAPSLSQEATASKNSLAAQMVWALKQNERTVQIRTNALNVSFYGIQNGVISLALAVILMAGAIVSSGTDSRAGRSVDDPIHCTRMSSPHPTTSETSASEATEQPVQPPVEVDDYAASSEAIDPLRQSANGVRMGANCSLRSPGTTNK